MNWLAAGRHGEMDYMARHGTARARPAELVPGHGARDHGAHGLLARRARAARTRCSRRPRTRLRLALRARPRLPQGAARAARAARRPHRRARWGRSAIACSPTARRCWRSRSPRKAGLGWRGKHTLLLTREAGSYFFLGEIYTDLPLPVTPPVDDALRHLHALHRRVSRPAPSSRPTSSTRGAASPTSPSSSPAHSRAAAPAHRQPRLRLRRLPARVPVEPVRASRRARPISPRCATASTTPLWSSCSRGRRRSSTAAPERDPAHRLRALAAQHRGGLGNAPARAVVAALQRARGPVAARARARAWALARHEGAAARIATERDSRLRIAPPDRLPCE